MTTWQRSSPPTTTPDDAGGEVPEPPAGAAGTAGADADAALGQARAALEAVAAELEARGRAAGGDARDVLEAQAMMLRDPGLDEQVAGLTAQGRSAARAVWEGFAVYREALAGAGEYMAARVADLDDLRARTVARLLGVPVPGVPDPGHPFVLAARDLAPADTVTLDAAKVLGFVTEEGGPTSHTAILAVLSLDVRGGEEVVLAADGEQADAALDNLAAVVAADHDAR